MNRPFIFVCGIFVAYSIWRLFVFPSKLWPFHKSIKDGKDVGDDSVHFMLRIPQRRTMMRGRVEKSPRTWESIFCIMLSRKPRLSPDWTPMERTRGWAIVLRLYRLTRTTCLRKTRWRRTETATTRVTFLLSRTRATETSTVVLRPSRRVMMVFTHNSHTRN